MMIDKTRTALDHARNKLEQQLMDAYYHSNIYVWQDITGTANPIVNHAVYQLLFNAPDAVCENVSDVAIEAELRAAVDEEEDWRNRGRVKQA